MHRLRANNTGVSSTTSLPKSEMDDSSAAGSGGGPVSKPKTPLRKEELEKIAQQLKRRLLKASITAKQAKTPDRAHSSQNSFGSSQSGLQASGGGTGGGAGGRGSRPLGSPAVGGVLLSSPIDLLSPAGRSPTHMRTPSALYSMRRGNAGSSDSSLLGSPRGSRVTAPSSSAGQHMLLHEVAKPGASAPEASVAVSDSLPAPVPASASASTSALGDTSGPEIAPSSIQEESADADAAGDTSELATPAAQTTPTLPKKQLATLLLRTPTQPQRTPRPGQYNDAEGADLLMYLATLPSPARPTPRQSSGFTAPPPLTPKRPLGAHASARTPQRLTPLVNLLSTFNAAGLPSAALTLTPAGFNMNDYVNFFTPSPGTSMAAKTRTPEVRHVDGKMINFDREGMFNGDRGE